MSPVLSTHGSEDPGAQLAHLAQWSLTTTAHVVLGVLLGMLAAHAMRRRHLHWSWAAMALAPLLLVSSSAGGPAASIAAPAALVALARGWRWHREDLRAGADLAAVAADRTTPLHALSALARSLRRPAAASLAAGDALCVGTGARGRPVAIEVGGVGGRAGAGTHTLVAGATGSGKTVTLTWLASSAVARGMAAVVVDPKGDRWMREHLRRAARAAGRRFLEWTPAGPTVYNPYGRGGETEIADKALAGERFTEPHYQRQAQRYLGHAVRVLRAGGVEVSLRSLVAALDPARLEVLTRALDPEHAQAVHEYLDSLTARQRSDLTGVRDRLAIVAESDVGRWLDPAEAGAVAPAETGALTLAEAGALAPAEAGTLDLLEAVRDGAVVYFDLRADSRPLLARMLAGAVVQDLQTVVSALQGDPARWVVVIDEFAAVAAEHVAALFGRARSAGACLLLGTQELSDLRLPGHEHLREQVLGNLTALVAHRQVVPESAELISRLAGGRGAWRTTLASDGRHTRTRTTERLLAPEEVMGLHRGCAAVLRLAAPRGVELARMLTPDDPRSA